MEKSVVCTTLQRPRLLEELKRPSHRARGMERFRTYVAHATLEWHGIWRSCHSCPTRLEVYEGVCVPLLKFILGLRMISE